MYETAYKTNPENGNCIIEIALDNYVEFFHEWDNTSFKKRDIHPELAEFLDICSEDIPLKKGLEIHVCLDAGRLDPDSEKAVRGSYEHYYEFLSRSEGKKIRKNITKSVFLAVIGIVLIVLHAVVDREVAEAVWSVAVLEGIHIGGWVFLWESLHTMAFGSSELLHRKRELERFRKAPILFRYGGC